MSNLIDFYDDKVIYLFALYLCIFFHIYQNFSIQQFGASSGRASIASCGSLPPTQVFTTIGIYKGDRVAIKKITKKKVIFLVHNLSYVGVGCRRLFHSFLFFNIQFP